MNSESAKTYNLYYPPGGILIWIIVFIEMVTFMIALVAFAIQHHENSSIFHDSQLLLNKNFGALNTLFLLTAGYFMAEAVRKLKMGDQRSSQNKIVFSIFFGLAFLGLKGFEYFDKISHGIGLDHSDFFMYYWLLTGFHFIHVLAGLVILSVLYFYVRKGLYSDNNYDDVEAGATFWHMCDLIWLILFPMLYLL